MNEIFILRHGKAEDIHETQSKNDFDRRLTEEGQKKTNKLGLFFNSLEENVDLVLSSPYLRAKETAEIFVRNLDPKPDLKIVDFLSCGNASKEIAKGLSEHIIKNKVVLIGHAPDLELFLKNLIGSSDIKLKKGSLAKVILKNHLTLSGELEWLITPSILKNYKLKKEPQPKT